MSESPRAAVVKFDGIDGCGKTTLVHSLEEIFSKSVRVAVSAEYGSKLDACSQHSKEKLPLSLLLKNIAIDRTHGFDDIERELMWAIISRRHNRKILKKNLHSNDLILVDRSNLSNLAYGLELDEFLLKIFERYNSAVELVDLTFWIDTPVSLCWERLSERNLDPIESKGQHFLERVRNNFLKIHENSNGVIRIDGSRTLDFQINFAKKMIENLDLNSKTS